MQDNDPVSLTYGQLSDMVERIEQIPPLSGAGAPTTSTMAYHLGQRYINTTTGDAYYCTEIPQSGTTGYVWQPVDTSASYTAGDGIDITNAVISATNTGKAKALTADDYNWPTSGTKTSIALWRLNPGFYYWSTSSSIEVRTSNTSSSMTKHGFALIGVTDSGYAGGGSGHKTALFTLRYDDGDSNKPLKYYVYAADSTNGSTTSNGSIPLGITSSLTNPVTNFALASSSGKVLKDLIDSLVIKNAGAPTTATVGTVGMLLEDTTNGKLYICTAIVPGTDPDPDTYTWTEVGAGGSGPTVVQTTGTSTTDVMSQDATTSMVYADPSTKYRVQIGAGASVNTAGDSGVAIGRGVSVTAPGAVAIGQAAGVSNVSLKGSIALGAFSASGITSAGMINVGSSSTSYGYNSSNYRLLTGLYDGQSNHDAATYGQLSTAILNGGTTAPTTATVGAVGTLYACVESGTGKLYICTNADTTTPSYTWSALI